MSAPVAATPAPRRKQWLAVVGMLRATLQIAGGVLESIDRLLPGEEQFVSRTAIMGVAYLLFLSTLWGLELTGAAGHGWLPHTGLLIAAAGWVLYAVAQFALPIDFTIAETVLFPTGTILIGAGMTVVGVAVIRAGVWAGWRRFIVLVCGVFPFVVIFPTFAITGGPSFLALSAWGACWLTLGGAIWMNRNEP